MPTAPRRTRATGISPLAERFDRIAEQYPHRDALRVGRDTVTYGELATRLSAGVACLDAMDLDITTPIAVRVDDSLAAVIRLLTVLASGYPTVPIDASSPAARAEAMIDQAGALAFPGTDLPSATHHGSLPECTALLFTSGSTGSPKAVRQGPRLWHNQIDEIADRLQIAPGQRLSLAMPPSYGGGLDILMTAVSVGAALQVALPGDRTITGMLDTLTEWRPTSLHLSPTLMRGLVSAPGAPRMLHQVRLVCTVGDWVHSKDVAAMRAVAPAVTFVNRSGASEAGNLTFNVLPPGSDVPDGPVAAGRIARDKAITVVDEAGSQLPEGHEGRLVVTSEFLAEGYLIDGVAADFELLADGRRRFVTGDRGRVDGDVLFLAGRVDDTVKIRGYRVDLHEVATAIHALPGIDDAKVVARQTDTGVELIAYLVAGGGRAPSIASVRTGLAQRLPFWMLPTHCVLLDRIPRNSRGKVDVAALPAPSARPAFVSPETATEHLLAEIWKPLLAIGEVGRGDDFLSLGGDSLTVVEMLAQIAEMFGTVLDSGSVVGSPTLAALAAQIDSRASTRGNPDVVPLSGDDPADRKRPVVFAFAGAGGWGLMFAPLAARLPGYRVIGLQPHALERRGIPDWSIRRAALRHARLITDIAPDGPYLFLGHSLGGVIAMETARILETRGAEVAHIVVLDTILSGPLARGARVELGGTTTALADIDLVPTPRRELWRTRARLISAGWWPRPATAQWDLFWELGRRVAFLHRLEPWTGPTTVVVAEDNPDPTRWWSVLTPACAAVHRVAGDHSGMLRAPQVDRVAEHVMTALEQSSRPAVPDAADTAPPDMGSVPGTPR